jgi:hypothetical protein
MSELTHKLMHKLMDELMHKYLGGEVIFILSIMALDIKNFYQEIYQESYQRQHF